MLRHYILIAWRNIVRHKFYSIVLLAGLTIGVAASLMLGLYTWHELTCDNFHAKKDRIYLVGVRGKEASEEWEGGWTPPPAGPALAEYFPEIETQARLCYWFDEVVVSKGDKKYVEEHLLGADSTIFDVFTINFVSGDRHSALREPNSVVLTQSAARKYFGDEDPVGKTLHFDSFFSECIVTGVVEDYPDHSHFDFDVLFSLSSLRNIHFDFDHWSNHTFVTYVVLNEGAARENIASRMPAFVKANLDPYLTKRYQKTYDEFYRNGDYYSLFLEPLADVHLGTLVYENREGKKATVYTLVWIGVIILALVVINYTNLSTVLTLGRSREVGIRKVAGSRGARLRLQFLTESVIMSLLSVVVGVALVQLLLPAFNQLTGVSLAFRYEPSLIIGLALFAVATGVLSGLYPAIVFSSFSPVKALKGNVQHGEKGTWLRNVLVTLQFTACMALIVCTVVIFNQLDFMTSRNLGFNKDQVLVLKRAWGLGDKKTAFKQSLLHLGGVQSVSYSETTPGRHFNGHGQRFAGEPQDVQHTIYPLVADKDILKTLDLELVQGQGLEAADAAHPKALLNEAAVKELNFENPLDEKIVSGTFGNTEVTIAGVVKDFQFKSLRYKLEPLVIYSLDVDNDTQYRASFVLIKINAPDMRQTLATIEAEWKKFSNHYPFEYTFLSDDYDKLFAREKTMSVVYTIFSGIAISIACLGLLGLTSYMVNRRNKELGIRKIVGASVGNITLLLSSGFLKLLLLSFFAGSAVAWYLMSRWLDGFTYRTDISGWVFAIGGLLMLTIAALAMSYHLYKAATRNPVEALKYE